VNLTLERQPENPYQLKPTRLLQYELGPKLAWYGAPKENPLVSQQDLASIFFFFKKQLGPETINPLLEKILAAGPEKLSRISCGLASLISLVKSFSLDQNWPKSVGQYDAPRIIADLTQLHGSSALNPLTRQPLDQGWLAFANADQAIEQWSIYHHALAHEIEQLSDNKLTTFGLKKFDQKSLRKILQSGAKVIVSVDNSMIAADRFKSNRDLNQGTHLVSLLGASPKGAWLLLADPYVEKFSRADSLNEAAAKPDWIKAKKLFGFLKPQDQRFAVAAVLKENANDFAEQFKELTYPLARPS